MALDHDDVDLSDSGKLSLRCLSVMFSNIKHTIKEFPSYKPKEKVNYTIRIFLNLSVLTLLVFLLHKLFKFIYSGSFCVVVESFLDGLDSGDWLSFWGSLIGSIVAMMGIVWTLRYERGRDREQKRLNAQPILAVRHTKVGNFTGMEIGDAKFYVYFLLTDMKSYPADWDWDADDQIILKSSELVLKNTGQNAAINIDLTLVLVRGSKCINERNKETDTGSIAYLAPGECIVLKPFILSTRQELIEMLKWEEIEENTPYYLERWYPALYHHFDEIELKRISSVSNLKFVLKMNYSNIYGDDIYRSTIISFYVVQFDTGKIDMISENYMREMRDVEF